MIDVFRMLLFFLDFLPAILVDAPSALARA
jgi:hypothetical protein